MDGAKVYLKWSLLNNIMDSFPAWSWLFASHSSGFSPFINGGPGDVQRRPRSQFQYLSYVMLCLPRSDQIGPSQATSWRRTYGFLESQLCYSRKAEVDSEQLSKVEDVLSKTESTISSSGSIWIEKEHGKAAFLGLAVQHDLCLVDDERWNGNFCLELH